MIVITGFETESGKHKICTFTDNFSAAIRLVDYKRCLLALTGWHLVRIEFEAASGLHKICSFTDHISDAIRCVQFLSCSLIISVEHFASIICPSFHLELKLEG